MALDLDAIKAKLTELQTSSGGNRNSDVFWKPPTGKSQVRIVLETKKIGRWEERWNQSSDAMLQSL